jgi:hypothetical protein
MVSPRGRALPRYTLATLRADRSDPWQFLYNVCSDLPLMLCPRSWSPCRVVRTVDDDVDISTTLSLKIRKFEGEYDFLSSLYR